MARPKVLTREQVESRKEKAERFTRDVLGDSERADEIANEDLEDYAERRRIELSNPPERRKVTMARKRVMSREEMMDKIDALEQENAELQEKLDDIGSILEEPEEGDEENGDEDDDE